MYVTGDWTREAFKLDPKKPAAPQIASNVAGVAYIIAGPLLGLVTIAHYPPLVMDRVIYSVGLGSIAVWFALSWPLIPDRKLPRGMPLFQKLAFRAGWALCTTGWLLGIGGIANGYGMPVSSRDVPAVAKHETRHRDAARRSHYVSIRAWPGERRIVDLDAPADVYARLDLPVTAIGTPQGELQTMPDAATVRLRVGEGRLGLPWLAGIELPEAGAR
jgi:hypothetical protein